MRKIALVALLGFGSLLIAGIDEEAVAQRRTSGGPPVVDVEATCREAERQIVAIFGSDTAVSVGGCLTEEQAAREQLVKGWSSYTSADRQLCVSPKQYMPSYIEWLTCFEMQSFVRQIRRDSVSKK